jgi:FtsH-binding integral membrane protein
MTFETNRKLKRIAGLLLVPAVLISVAAVFLLPWMLETKRRLDNAYWEGQLTFAMICLSVAAAGTPFLLLRVFDSALVVAITSWVVAAIGYILVFAFMVQAHLLLGPRLAIGAASVGLSIVAGYALRLDLSRPPARP